MNLDFTDIIPSMPYILEGVYTTLQIAALAALFGFLLGTIIALCKITTIKPLIWLSDFYTSIFRGTPLVLQLMIIYFASPQLFGFQIELTLFLQNINKKRTLKQEFSLFYKEF